jgi:hypothetical protein
LSLRRDSAAPKKNPQNETTIADRRRSLCIGGDADAIGFCNAARYRGHADHEF